ncbi:hypothetical protein F4810DRAFT_667386 [Camillea tinctor]|nr:hypothetical protein F4810DRAFT_667386 [Camillea tinctor]
MKKIEKRTPVRRPPSPTPAARPKARPRTKSGSRSSPLSIQQGPRGAPYRHPCGQVESKGGLPLRAGSQ